MNKKTRIAITIIILTASALTAYSSKLPIALAQTSQLTITGLVANPMTLSIVEIQAMPNTTEYAQLFCVSSATWPVQKGTWTGVSLAYLLQQANVSSDALKLAFFASDGYSTDLTVQAAMQNINIIVAYQFDNTSLNGLQLVVPFNWGYKWISDLTQIQLVNYNFLGTTETQGYPDDGTTANAYSEPDTLSNFTLPNPTGISLSTSTTFPTATPTTTNNQTTPVASSNPKLQPALANPPYALTASMLIAASAVASGVILTKRKKTKA